MKKFKKHSLTEKNKKLQQIIYFYDLPKEDLTSVKIVNVVKDYTGIILTDKPVIKKEHTKPFYSAMVYIKDPDHYNIICDKMRYFDINGKPCRGLGFDKQLLGSN